MENADSSQIAPDQMRRSVRIMKRKVNPARNALSDIYKNFDSLFSSMSDSVLLLDEDRAIISVNRAFSELWGYSPNEVSGMNLDILHEKSSVLNGKSDLIPGLIENNIPEEMDYRNKNGKIFICKTIVNPVWDNRENIIGYLVIHRNITEKKVLIDAVKNIATLPRENPNPILRIRNDGTLIFSNMAANAILSEWQSNIGKKIPAKVYNIIFKSLKSKKLDKFEINIGKITYLLNLVRVHDFNYINLYFFNISDRKKTEEALAKSEERYRLALRALKIGSWEWNIGEQSFYLSDYTELILGISKRIFKGGLRIFLKKVHPEDRTLVSETIRSLFKNDHIQTMEHRITFPDGGTRWISVSGMPLRKPNGDPVRFIGTIKDITEDKSSEERMLMLSLGMELLLLSPN